MGELEAEDLLSELVGYAQENGWTLMQHQVIREIEPMYQLASEGGSQAGMKEKVEYAARKMAYSPLQQEFTYYYYCGQYKVFYDHLNYLKEPVDWKVSLSPRLIKHMVQRDKLDTACFVILDKDVNLSFSTGKAIADAIGPGRLVRLKSNIPMTSKWTPMIVPMGIFSNSDPFPDSRV